MNELIIGIIACVFLYWLGGILYEHDYPFKVIQQELIRMEREEE
tara:strand:+ start:1503 stop:1634 length:132 start_codon:yes stop_codon:yes gene_type:complete